MFSVPQPVEDFSTFFSAVIDDKVTLSSWWKPILPLGVYQRFSDLAVLFQSFARISRWLNHAKTSPNLSIIAGGNCDDRKGYFVEPTIVETKDPQDPIMSEVWTGPLLSPDEVYLTRTLVQMESSCRKSNLHLWTLI